MATQDNDRGIDVQQWLARLGGRFRVRGADRLRGSGLCFALIGVCFALSMTACASGDDSSEAPGTSALVTAGSAQNPTEATPAPGTPTGGSRHVVSLLRNEFEPTTAISIVNIDTGKQDEILQLDGPVTGISISADGQRLALARQLPSEDQFDLWVLRADGSEQIRLTDDAALESATAWTPDGTRVIYSANRTTGGELSAEGISDIRSAPSDGSAEAVVLTSAPDAFHALPALSKDGKTLAFSIGAGQNALLTGGQAKTALYRAPLRDNGARAIDPASLRKVAENAEAPFHWAPDGTEIYFSEPELVTVGSPELELLVSSGNVGAASAEGSERRILQDADAEVTAIASDPRGGELLVAKVNYKPRLPKVSYALLNPETGSELPLPQLSRFQVHDGWSLGVWLTELQADGLSLNAAEGD